MSDSINLYGDTLVKTTGTHGADISSQRMDDLDIETLKYALQLIGEDRAAIDLGCGIGLQGMRLASLGINTVLIDLLPTESTILRFNGLSSLLPLSYLEIDARNLESTQLPSEISICYSQRFIHYLKFEEAVSLLQRIRSRMPHGARLFISASGLFSELGSNYLDRGADLRSRFSLLDGEMAEKHDIHQPICLYTPEELTFLCEQASFRCDRVFSSSFGNVKGIFYAE